MQFAEYQPLEEYKNTYKTLHQNNVSEYFEDLLRQSQVNENENQTTVKQINETTQRLAKVKSSFNAKKNWRVFLIFLTVILFAVSVYFIYSLYNGQYLEQKQNIIIAICFSIVFAILFMFLIIKILNPKIKNLNSIIDQLQNELNDLIALAKSQVAPLLALFSNRIPARLSEKTYPLIRLDDAFDIRRFDCLHRKYHLGDNDNVNESTFYVQSGEINGNPFCFFKTLNHFMGTKTYRGTKTIYWTEYYTDAQGKRQSRSRSEVLVATVTKPFPEYYDQIFLVYGNEAAPNLSFNRNPSNANELTDKQIEKKVAKETKKQESLMRRLISKGKNFTMMANSDFEALFGATDRDNEVEFRLLFTPVAQREILKLIKDKTESWGDDFGFRKKKMINSIFPQHLQSIDITGNTDTYTHYDVAEIRKRFNDYNNLYFKAVYFSFAPLLAIPLYQQHKPHEFIYRDVYDSHWCGYEHEYAVNRMDVNVFRHPLSVTKNILKTRHYASDNESDSVTVNAYGYKSTPRTTYVSVWGGDGRMHDVRVDWDEYGLLNKQTNITLKI
jgi:ABC-type multidrug transport system fused ATPase/permease subunit